MPAFSLVSWLKQRLDGPAWKRRRSRLFFQPQLTALEDRVAPAAFTVNTFADTNATNLTTGTDSTGHVSLRSAMQAANHLGLSNTIGLPAGTYDLSLGQLGIKNNLTLTGAGASSTTINAQYTSRIFQIFSGFTVAISEVTMEEGGVQGAAGGLAAGGAIFDSGALALTNDTLFDNLAHGGDGAAGASGPNGANGTSTTPPTPGGAGGNGQRGGDAEGGAIYLDSSAKAALSIVSCTIINNEAFQGQGGSGGQGGNGGSGTDQLQFQLGGNGGAGGSGGQGGNAFGGAIFNAAGSLVIQGSLFSGNFAGLSSFLFGPIAGGGSGGAGGLGGIGPDPTLDGNGGNGGLAGGDFGGAIYNSASGSVAITTSSFFQNSAVGERGGQAGTGGGGGLGTYGGTGGTGGSAADASGGAIDNHGTMKIDNTSLFQNQAIGTNGGPGGTGGAGGYGQDALGGNGGNGGNGGFGGSDFAGAIESFTGSLTLTHSTVSLNSVGPGAGGVAGAGGAGGRGTFGNGMPGHPGVAGVSGISRDGGIQSVSAKSQLFDTIVAGDTAPTNPDVNGLFSSLGHNLIGDGTGGTGFTAAADQVGTTAQPVNPMLNPPGNYGGPTPTMVPQLGSPAIDAGDNTNAPASDQRGFPRIVDADPNVDSDGPVIDIGAVEFQPTDRARLLLDINPGSPSSNPRYFTQVNNLAFFIADDGVHGSQLWESNGSAAGTLMVHDFNSGKPNSYVGSPTTVNGILFFDANDGTHGSELWATNGTTAGTFLVADITPGANGSYPNQLTNVNGTLFFSASDGTHGRELWRSNGSAAGTLMVRDIKSGAPSSYPAWLTNVNGTLFFAADDGTHGNELWESNGSAAGTFLVADITASPSGSYPSQLTNVNGTLFFVANHSNQVWVSNGTAAGTSMVLDLNSGRPRSYPASLTNVNGTLFFSAGDFIHGRELWESNGTAAGTFMVLDINSGKSSSYPGSLTNVNGTLFFSANDGTHGSELWASNGTAAGTFLVADIDPGANGSYPNQLTNVNGTLFFSANDGTHGYELWESNGTAAGTALVADPGSGSGLVTGLAYLTNVSGALFFSAYNPTFGQEPWILPVSTLTTTTIASSANPSTIGQAVAFTATISVAPGSVNPTGTVDFQEGTTDLTPGGVSVTGGQATFSTNALAVGNHTITATYSGDSTFTGSQGNYIVTIAKVRPTIAAHAGPTVRLGSGAKLTAAAALTNGYHETGVLTFVLYAPNNVIVDTESVPVSGNGIYTTPHGYLPKVAGTYEWVAVYLGDSNNQSVRTIKGKTNEVVVILDITILHNSPYLVGGTTSDRVTLQANGKDTVPVDNGNQGTVSITSGNDLVVIGDGKDESVAIVDTGDETARPRISGNGRGTFKLGKGWTIV
jgi:ELWxxDGT repeat protein